MASGRKNVGQDASIGLVKFVSWGTLAITLLSSLFLSIFLANYARNVLLNKQLDIAQLLANTLNTVITKRFYSPVYWQTMGNVNLSNPEQYKLLDELIQENMKAAPFKEVRIYDMNGVVIYAQDSSLVGRKGLGGTPVAQAINQDISSKEFIYRQGAFGIFFSMNIAPGSVLMRITTPIRFKGVLPVAGDLPGETQKEKPGTNAESPADGPVTGPNASHPDEGLQGGPNASRPTDGQGTLHALGQSSGTGTGSPAGRLAEVEGTIGGLEFTLDITPDYERLVNFQRIIIISALGSSMVLLLVLRMLIRRADRINIQRMREQERFEKEIAQNEKLASMGRMVAGIAHEIRNPLGIIRSSAELLVSRQKDKDPLTAKILTAIHEEAVRLSKTVGDFLDYARPKALKLEPVDLGALVNQVLAFLEQKCREQGVEVTRDMAPEVMVQADKDLLYRAIYNILVNALEAMADAGSSHKDDAVRGQIVISVRQENGQARLCVTDTGPGIPPDLKDKLLDPFFTTKESGTGLGLAITANILRSHGAALTLGDNPEGGARVDIAFAKT